MQRAGLPIYPDELCQRWQHNGNEENQNVGRLTNDTIQHNDFSQLDNFDIPDVDLLKFCSGLSDGPSTLDMADSLFELNSDSAYGYNMILPMHPSKRFRPPDMLYPSYESFIGDVVLDTGDQFQFHDDKLNGSHATLNGNYISSSAPISEAMKLELPSLQYTETQHGSWGTPTSPLPPLESVDTLIQSPAVESLQSEALSPETSGLLEAIVHNSKSSKDSNNDSLQVTTNIPNEAVKTETLSPCETEWDKQGEPYSPLGQSVASGLFLTDNASMSMCSLYGSHIETIQDHGIKHEAVTQLSDFSSGKEISFNQMDFTNADAFLDLGWFGDNIEHSNEQCVIKGALNALRMNDDF